MSEEIPEDVQRWPSKRREALVLSILKGETSVQEAARKHGLTVAEIEDWRERFCSLPRTLYGRGPRTRKPSRTNASRSSSARSARWSWTWTSCGRECRPTSLWTARPPTSPERDCRRLPAKASWRASGLALCASRAPSA
jgi:hypothetical protein